MDRTSRLASPLSIGYFSPGWPLEAFSNGIVSYVADMADQLRGMGHRVTIVSGEVIGQGQDASVYNLQSFLPSRGLRQRVVDKLAYRIAPWWVRHRPLHRAAAAAVRRAIVDRDIQIFEMEETFGWARWVRRAVSIPFCVRLHGPWFLNGAAGGLPKDAAFYRQVTEEGRAIAEAYAVSSSSRNVLEQVRAYYGLSLSEAEVIYPPALPIPLAERWQLASCDRDQVLFIGRFDRHKGGDLILEAFGRVLQEVPRARLTFVGPDRGWADPNGRRWNLEQFVRDRLPGALESGHVTLLGQQPFSALTALRRKAMMTTVCSRYENAPRALIEAMSLGCPIIAARVGGIPEIMEDEVDGVLHRPDDSDDLAAQIIGLLNNPERAAELGRQSAVSCERRFAPDVIATRSVEFYRETLRRHGSRERSYHTA
jgi:glycosyltransferase involved in cell wall biosynthesis